jgi:hypothetical protein
VNKRTYILVIGFVIIVTFLIKMISSISAQVIDNPLPSWNNGEVKRSIIEFVTRITTADSPDFVPVADRIATFDNDGTLWAEQPVVQGMFVLEKLQAMAAADPSLTQRQPFQAALEGDVEYFKQAGEAAIMELLTATHTNMTQEQFQQEVQQFFATAIHPMLNVPYTKVTYRPMVELLEYLRANQFQTWICSGGGIDFMRVVSESLYGIPPEQVIGSFVKEEFIEVDGKDVIWRLPEIARINDYAGKPIGIDLHIGKRPVFAAGNERTGGDIAMLTYSQQQQPSFQLLINHDDGDREFAYQEPGNASLNAAQANGWQVVSIKNDWQTVFSFQQ